MKSIRKKVSAVMLSILTIMSLLLGSFLVTKTPVNAQPKTISGNCYVKLVAIHLSHSWASEFDITMPDGEVKRGYCINPGRYVREDGEYPFIGTLNNDGTYDITVNTYEDYPDGLVPWDKLHPEQQKIGLNKGKPKPVQNVGKFTWAPKGRAKLVKMIADNKAITDECKKIYSLKGAEYYISKNFDGSGYVGMFTTKEDGTADPVELNIGNYYVKEVKAPKGFAIDSKVYGVEIKAGETAVIESKDSPLFDPLSIVLQKTSAKNSYLNLGADMSDAEFEINYYDTLDDDLSNYTPLRKWKLKTIKDERNSKYTAKLSNKYILGGSDELFINEKGEIVLPMGTISIRETKAPKGYKLDSKVYTFTIDKNDQFANVELNLGNIPELKNEPLIPEIKTTAMSENTKNNVGEYGKKIRIIDKVSYKELSEGETYTIKGKLMDKEMGKPLKDKDGKEIIAEKTFTVTKENSVINGDGARGEVELLYEIDSTLLKGKTIVVFEKLFYDGKEIASHEDINDEAQSVHFPEIKTVAKSKESGTNIGSPSKEETIIDIVKYNNLILGKEYIVKGKLIDKKSGEPIRDKDGMEIRAEKSFISDKSDGKVEVEFNYDSRIREGEETVVFEELRQNGKIVAVHKDINDEDQTVVYPKVRTTLAGMDGKKIVKASKDTKLVDVVSYENLIEGKEYTIKGELMAKESGKPLVQDGKNVEGLAKFTAKSTKGTVNVVFTLDTTKLDNKEIVAYETVYNERDEKVVNHSDINNEEQTVKIITPPKTGEISSANKLLFIIFGMGCLELILIIMIKNRTNVRFLG